MTKIRSHLALTACALLFGLCSAPASADAEGTLTLYLNGGYYWFDSGRLDGTLLEGLELEDSWGGGGGLGYMITDRWGMEGVYDFFTADVHGSSEKLDVQNYHLDILYQFAGRFCGNFCWQPYVAFGAGEMRIDFDDPLDPLLEDHDRQGMVNLGLGVKYLLGPRWQARADARAFQGVEHGGLDGFVSISIGYQWGDDLVVPRDHDRDGVPTGVDQCPTTPYGLPVDANGCPLESDGDGVPDYLDQCPDTPLGIPVNEYGCSI